MRGLHSLVQIINYDPAKPNKRIAKSNIITQLQQKYHFHIPSTLKIPDILKSKKFWIRFGIATVPLVFLISVFIIWPGLQLANSVKRLQKDVKIVQTDASAQNVVAADRDLDTVKNDLADTKVKYEAFGWTGWIPLLGWYYHDGYHLLTAGGYGVDAGKVITKSLLPFADVLGLKGQNSNDTAEGKLQKVVDIMPKIAPDTDVVAAKLSLVNTELQQVDPNRYPQSIGNTPIKSSLQLAKDLVKTISDFMPQAKEVLTYAPQGLGSPSPKKYMVIFQNDKELRPSGGFLTAYTFATFDHGKVSTTSTDDIYNLDTTISNKPTAPAPILKYLPLVPRWNLRDTNLSPDFVSSMSSFESLYRRSPRYQGNDGYIGLDTYFLQSLLRLTGPVKVASTGDTFTADNVVEKMETYAEKVFLNSPNRKGFLGDLMKGVMDKLKNSKSDQWNTIIQTVLTQANEKHILLYSKDPNVQTLIEKYDWAGRIRDFSGDYLHINDSNFAGAKANLYITEKITQDITISNSGEVTKKVTIEVTNPAKSDGWLNGPYRDWVRMYVPQGSTFLSASGGEVKTSVTASELGKTMFESFFIARPIGAGYSSNKGIWGVNYKLPNAVSGKTYKILVQKQPGVDGPEMVININGQQKIDEQLRTDKEYDLSF